VEINSTFYRMPFSFVLKASRRITHQRRIDDVKDPVDFLFEKAATLGERLDPVLFQLPPYMQKDVERLRSVLAMLPRGRRASMEFRHISWFDDEVYDALRAHDVALCFADGEIKEETPMASTAGWGYLRLRRVEYEDDALRQWVDEVRSHDSKETFVFFKHEEAGTGPRLAARFRELCDD
jgi:uncharacterized protein YecE (DUF72 family)